MRTEFSITARQIKEIFPKSKLKSEHLVFRGLSEKDIPELCAIDPPKSEDYFSPSLEAENEQVILVADFKGMLLGYMTILTSTEGILLVRVFVKTNCEYRGIGAALLVSFFCFALSRRANKISVLRPGSTKVWDILLMLGIKDPRKIISSEEMVKQLEKRGVDLSKYRA